jgi:DNA-binding FadR family transcriptional regulator
MPSTKITADGAPEIDLLHTLDLREVRVRRQFEAICDQVRQQLLRGDLRPGDRLPGEREMAEQFKVSRSVVREATRSLESIGVVESRTGVNGGVFVRGSTPVGITQAMNDMVSLGQMPIGTVTETRIEITCMAIRLACVRATDADFDAIKADIDLHAELFKFGGGSRNARSMGEFYRLIAQSTHNDMIVMIVDAVSEVMRTLLARIDPAPHPDMIAVRRKVLRHLRARDAEKACAALSVHLAHLNDYLESESRART